MEKRYERLKGIMWPRSVGKDFDDLTSEDRTIRDSMLKLEECLQEVVTARASIEHLQQGGPVEELSGIGSSTVFHRYVFKTSVIEDIASFKERISSLPGEDVYKRIQETMKDALREYKYSFSDCVRPLAEVDDLEETLEYQFTRMDPEEFDIAKKASALHMRYVVSGISEIMEEARDKYKRRLGLSFEGKVSELSTDERLKLEQLRLGLATKILDYSLGDLLYKLEDSESAKDALGVIEYFQEKRAKDIEPFLQVSQEARELLDSGDVKEQLSLGGDKGYHLHFVLSELGGVVDEMYRRG
jgi:hypothetical protein